MVEVVFELRWNLQSGPQGEVVLQSDPGLLPLLDRFSKQMRKIGFSSSRDMSHPLQTGPYGIVRRYFRSVNEPFPIQQIGPGIYATNEDAKYDWVSFKAQALKGLKALFDSYPKLDFFPLIPRHLELRYIDAFKPSLVSSREGFLGFVREGMNATIELPDIFQDKSVFDTESMGRLVVQKTLKQHKGTTMVLDVGSGKRAAEDIIRMETKVVTLGEGIPNVTTPVRMIRELGDWLEVAHNVLSPTFRQLVRKEVLAKYGLAN